MINLTLRVTKETRVLKSPGLREMEPHVETLCDIKEQDFSSRMLAAALRELADEVDPRHLRSDSGVAF